MCRKVSPTFLALWALVAASCGRETEAPVTPPVIEDPPIVGACTGAVPEHASLCPSADQGLTADAPRVLVAVCSCDASCHATTPCSYACDAGFELAAGACEAIPPESVTVTANGDGTVTVTDARGARVWLEDANCAGRPVTWYEAASWAAALASGTCGLTDGSSAGDWRVPDDAELLTLANDLAVVGSSATSAFTNVQTLAYWDTFSTCIGIYGTVEIASGHTRDVAATELYGVWPVRDAP